jgi:hypothetical protein
MLYKHVTAKRNFIQAKSLFVFDSDGNLVYEIVLDRVYENILDMNVIEDNLSGLGAKVRLRVCFKKSLSMFKPLWNF